MGFIKIEPYVSYVRKFMQEVIALIYQLFINTAKDFGTKLLHNSDSKYVVP